MRPSTAPKGQAKTVLPGHKVLPMLSQDKSSKALLNRILTRRHLLGASFLVAISSPSFFSEGYSTMTPQDTLSCLEKEWGKPFPPSLQKAIQHELVEQQNTLKALRAFPLQDGGDEPAPTLRVLPRGN